MTESRAEYAKFSNAVAGALTEYAESEGHHRPRFSARYRTAARAWRTLHPDSEFGNEFGPWPAPKAAPKVPDVYVQLHTGSPGLDGTENQSAVTTRHPGTITESGEILVSAPYFMTTYELITDLSVWDSAVSGDFLLATPLRSAQYVHSRDTLSVTSLGLPGGRLGQLMLDSLRQVTE